MEKEIVISNRYYVKRKIGEGGMAKVYLAYDDKLKHDVALKILKRENVDEKKVRSFKREARTLGLLDDPNIVSMYDVGEENGIHYIANEFVEGMSLKEYISACSPLPIEEVIKITGQILSGLAHAHERGVVHKDIKSQNILLDTKRNVKITDLGIANIIDEEITRTQSLMGTPQYVAPEILNREELTVQSDIYSVGILLYEMLIGKAPFTGEKPAIIMIKQMNHPLPSITEQRQDVPQAIENIAIRASAKKLENRYKNVKQMQDDLHKLELGNLHEPKLILENDLVDDKKFEKTVVLDTTKLEVESTKPDPEQNAKKVRYGLLAIIGALLILLLVRRLMPQTEAMPNLVGKDIDSINLEEYINKEDFSIIYEYSNTVDENDIISTNPESGEKIKATDEIVFTVSKGPKSKDVKDYTEDKISDVKSELESSGYNVEINKVDDLSTKGTILHQTPSKGEEIIHGGTYTFDVSTGKMNMPNFTGLNKSEAEKWADENDVEIKENKTCTNAGTNADLVIKQTPAYDSEISTGDVLKISVVDDNCDKEESTTKYSSSSKNDSSDNEESTTKESSSKEESTTKESSSKEESTTKESSSEEASTTKESSSEEASTTKEVTTDEVTTDEVTTDEATTDEATTDEATTDEATTDEATTDEATTDEATTDEATTDEATTDEATTDEASNDSAEVVTDETTEQV